MMKMFIQLRKKTLLPFRWFLRQKKVESEMNIPTPREFLLRYKEERERLVAAERVSNQNLIEYTKGKTEILEWIIYGSSK